jgi:dihydropyrimidine dehydrogenase (NAD+) subunit PreT
MTPRTGNSRGVPSERLELKIVDAKPVYSAGEAVAEANRCLYCHDAPCIQACPTGIDIPTFIRKIATGNVRGSARVILSANLMGYSCARVCPVEVLCVGACVYNAWHRTPPIAIGRLQRFAVENAFESAAAPSLLAKSRPTGKKVACVGGGPASLTCAGYLALEGFEATVLESRATAGGLNLTGVAPYKMHAEGALAEVAFVRELGVTIREGVEVGRDVAPADLLRDYDAVFLGIGLGADAPLGIPGEAGPGVWGATAWIEKLKLDPDAEPPSARHAVVIGGGNTAIDAARELVKLGVADVSLVYRRTSAEMPGYAHEMELARREGVKLLEHAVPKAFVRTAGTDLAALELTDGRVLSCEIAMIAIGQAKRRELIRAFPGVAVDDKGRIVVDEATGRTGHPKVWAGGDALGGELVVTAVQEAKRAARSICATLGVTVRDGAAMNAGHR